MEKATSGFFRKKTNFAAVSNNALKDSRLSLKAKGLYALIQSYITIPNIRLEKGKLRNLCLEGEKSFDSAWKELKDSGYLKIYRSPTGNKDQFIYEYELLDEADDSIPAFLTLNKRGEVIPPKSSQQETSSHTPKKEACENDVPPVKNEPGPPQIAGIRNPESWHIPQNGGMPISFPSDEVSHPPRFAPYANGTPCEAHLMPKGGDKNNTKGNKTNDYKTYKSVRQSGKDGQTDNIREKLKDQIDYGYFEDNFPDDLPGVNLLIECMTNMLLSPTTRVGGYTQDQEAIRPYIEKADAEKIQGFLEHMKGRSMRDVRNVSAYWQSSLIDYLRGQELTLLTV